MPTPLPACASSAKPTASYAWLASSKTSMQARMRAMSRSRNATTSAVAAPAGRQTARPAAASGRLRAGGQHQLPQRRAPLRVARHGPPPATAVGDLLGGDVLGVGADRARDLHDVGELPLLQAEPELADLAVGSVGQYHWRHQVPCDQLVEQLQRELPLGPAPLGIVHVGLAAPLG